MSTGELIAHDHQVSADETDVFGFWIYIMTDCILFAALFAAFIVLTGQGAPGSALKNYLNLRGVLIETFLLLASNFTFCLASLNLYENKLVKVQGWLLLTFLLGAGFIFMEIREFIELAHEGYRWDISGQASAFFTLVSTHGLHVSMGLIWIFVTIIQLPILGITHITKRRMAYLGLFWNFLDIVWIFLFSIVYLIGAIS